MNQLSVSGATMAQPSWPSLANSPLAQLQRFQSALAASPAVPAATTAAGTTVSLSEQGLALAGTPARAAALGNAAISSAEDMLSQFAHSLLGSAADGMTLSFDTASVQADTRYASLLSQGSGNGAGTNAAAIDIGESADFIGQGHITTSDGQQFAFEVEVHYAAHLQAAASSSAGADAATAPSANDGSGTTATTAPTTTIPATATAAPTGTGSTPSSLSYAGTLDDLLAALAHQQLNKLFNAPTHSAKDSADAPAATDATTAAADAASPAGSLTLRLLDLIRTPQSLGAQVAQAYGVAANGSSTQAAA